MEQEQNKKSVLHNIIAIFMIIICVAVIVLSVLQIFGIWDKAVNVLVPLLGLNQLGMAYAQWKPNRKIAYFNLGAAAFILICSIVVFFVK